MADSWEDHVGESADAITEATEKLSVEEQLGTADKRLATTPEEALAATDPNDDHGIAEEKEIQVKKSVIEQEQQEEKKRDNNVEEEDDDDDDDDDERPKRGDGGDVLDTREHLNVVFMGHVDAGKSTISGQILYITGMVDSRTVEKYQKEAKDNNRGTWFLAFIMDTNEEERAKGKTVEVGRAHFESEKKRYTILDAPGHKNYVPNMIGGAAQADVGILVISARKGEFETGFEGGGQTREHTTLAKTLGVRQIIVAINKMDESTVNWSKERFDEIKKSMTPFLKQTGYNPKTDVHWIPVSGYSGANIRDPVEQAQCDWYQGPTLLQCLDDLKSLDRDPSGPLRIPCLDKFRYRGTTVLSGKVESGTLSKGLKVSIFPNDQQTTVSWIEVDGGREVSQALPGENVSVGMTGVSDSDLRSGFVLCDCDKPPVQVKSCFEAQIAIIDLLPHKPLMTAGYNAVMHLHTCVEEVQVVSLLAIFNKKTRKRSARAPTFVKTGSIMYAKLEAKQPVCAELFKDVQQLGRFTLRDEGKTIAIGKIIQFYD